MKREISKYRVSIVPNSQIIFFRICVQAWNDMQIYFANDGKYPITEGIRSEIALLGQGL